MDFSKLTLKINHSCPKKNRRLLYLSGFLVLLFVVISSLSTTYLVVVPAQGGSFSEAVVGYPRFINPVLAFSQTDKDISRLVFSGLTNINADGTWSNDVAASIDADESNKVFTITLHPDAQFHNNDPLTTEDVLFTYSLIQDPVIKSPLFPKFNTVTINAIDEQTIVFSLKNPNEHFPRELTVGIMSKKHWQDISLEEFPFATQNIVPLGSGPYAVARTERDNNQKIISLVLRSFESGTRVPYISQIELVFYNDQSAALSAFESGLVDNLANISAQELLDLDFSLNKKSIDTHPLERNFVLFFNNKNSVLESRGVRKLIENSIDRSEIVSQVFFGRADISHGPLPDSFAETLNFQYDELEQSNIDAIAKQEQWVRGESGQWVDADGAEISLNLYVPDSQEIIRVGELIQQQIESHGINVSLVITEESNLINNIIRKRDFDMVLFGQQIDTVDSLYAFWHSSRIADPGLNISGYVNKTVDAILERIVSPARTTDKTTADYKNFQERLHKDIPVVFLYHPHFVYATTQQIQNNDITHLRLASDRFNTVDTWYIQTEHLLPWFVQ